MARPQRKPINITPPARVVLDWLSRQPARVYDFSEVATGTRLKRPVAQRAITELRHPRSGEWLKDRGPDGLRLRQRHAFLPKDSDARSGIPQPEHPAEEAFEHPTVTALRRAHADKDAQDAQDATVRDEANALRGRVARQEKLRRKLAMAKQRQADGTERDEATNIVPTLEEVIEAGYSPATAAGIVAEQEALAAGKTPEQAEAAGAAAHEAARGREESVTDPNPTDPPYTSDEDVDAALGPDVAPTEPDLAPTASTEDNYEPSPEQADDADIEAPGVHVGGAPEPDAAPVSRRRRNK